MQIRSGENGFKHVESRTAIGCGNLRGSGADSCGRRKRQDTRFDVSCCQFDGSWYTALVYFGVDLYEQGSQRNARAYHAVGGRTSGKRMDFNLPLHVRTHSAQGY